MDDGMDECWMNCMDDTLVWMIFYTGIHIFSVYTLIIYGFNTDSTVIG